MSDLDPRTAAAVPPQSVLVAFGAASQFVVSPLSGGQGTSWQVGDIVLKPGDESDGAGTRRIAETMEYVGARVEATQAAGFRVARQVRATDGALVVEGWTATRILEGELRIAGPDDWETLFCVGRAFNEVLRDVERPSFLASRTDRWALADRVAFGEAEYDRPIPKVALLLHRLLEQRRPCSEPCQLIHGDLATNVLFAPGYDPAVIDFSPYWRPAAFAEAVMVVDLLLWHNAPGSIIEPCIERWGSNFIAHLLRALIFRLVAFSEYDYEVVGGFPDTATDRALETYDRAYAVIKDYQLRAVLSRRFDAVLCDIDGVLRHFSEMEPVERAHDLEPGTFVATAFAPHRLLPAITGEVTDEQWRAAIAQDLVPQCGSLAAAQEFVADWTSMGQQVDEEVCALLRSARSHVPVALLSNGTTRLESDLSALGLAEFNDNLVNSSRVGYAKPDPRVFEHAAATLGVAPERCLFVDDTLGHVQAARELGMPAVHFRTVEDLAEALRPLG